MSEIVPGDEIEEIVGIARHPTRHYACASSSEQVVYILHSQACKEQRDDLRDCLFSLALTSHGIDEHDWVGMEDQPVRVTVSRRNRLVPVRYGTNP